MGNLRFFVLADGWWHIFLDDNIGKYAQTIGAIIGIIAALTAIGTWAWRKVLTPLGRAISQIRDMYSTHEFVLEQVTKMRETIPLMHQVAEQCRRNGEEMRALISHTVSTTEAACIKAQLLYEDSPIARFECDLRGSCIWTNEAIQKLFGMDAPSMLGQGWLAALHQDDIRGTEKKWSETIAHWTPYRAVYRIRNSETGREITVEATAEMIVNSKGDPLSIWGKVVKYKAPAVDK